MAQAGKIRNQGKLLLLGIFLYGFATVVFGFSRYVWLSFLALFLIGAGDSISTIIRSTARQVLTPDYIKGRMMSINMIFYMGGPQLGEFEAGLLAGLIGAPLSVVAGGLGTLLIVGFMAVKIPLLRNYSGEEE
jgi:MFS family permease